MQLSDTILRAILAYPSRYALAKATGVSEGVLSRFVNGERDLRLATVDRLASALGLELVARVERNGRRNRRTNRSK